MKKLLLLLLLFVLMACEETQETDMAEALAIEYASDYLNPDINYYFMDIKRVDLVYDNGELKPIYENAMYGTYFFITYYYEFSNQDIITVLLVELWYETELKETIIEHKVTFV